MTDEAKALVERSETIRSQMYLDLVANDTQHKEMLDLIETQARENERLRERKTCCSCDKLFDGSGQGSWICNSCAGAD